MHSMLYATVGSENEAAKLAEYLLKRRLVACVNIVPSRSLFWWKGKIQEEGEFVLVMKTRTELVEQAIEKAKEIHPAKIPCLVSYTMGEGLPEYIRWVDRETRQPKSK